MSLCSVVLFCLLEHEIKRILQKKCLLSFSFSGERGVLDEKVLGSLAHSDYRMMTLIVTGGVPGLQVCLIWLLSFIILIHVFAIWFSIRSSQVCREKTKKPQVWEDVHHISG